MGCTTAKEVALNYLRSVGVELEKIISFAQENHESEYNYKKAMAVLEDLHTIEGAINIVESLEV